jgi:hypothetical protein
MRQIYDSILKVALTHPGLIVEYCDLVNDFQTTVRSLLCYLEIDEFHQANELRTEFINLMATVTDREKRKSEVTAFLGDRVGPTAYSDGEFGSYFLKHKIEIGRCYKAYDALLELRSQYGCLVKSL